MFIYIFVYIVWGGGGFIRQIFSCNSFRSYMRIFFGCECETKQKQFLIKLSSKIECRLCSLCPWQTRTTVNNISECTVFHRSINTCHKWGGGGAAGWGEFFCYSWCHSSYACSLNASLCRAPWHLFPPGCTLRLGSSILTCMYLVYIFGQHIYTHCCTRLCLCAKGSYYFFLVQSTESVSHPTSDTLFRQSGRNDE